MSFFTPGLYSKSYIEEPPSTVYSDEICPGVSDKLIGYDCRCRPWYQSAAVPISQNFTLVQDPYTNSNKQLTYFSINEYLKLDPYEGVATLDLNLENIWWNETITKYLKPGEFEKWVISTVNSNAVTFRSTYAATRDPKQTAEIVIDEVPEGATPNARAMTEQLRKLFEDSIYPIVDTGV